MFLQPSSGNILDIFKSTVQIINKCNVNKTTLKCDVAIK